MNDAQMLRKLRKRWAHGGRTGDRVGKLKGGYLGGHRRWHVARGIVNPACKLCRKGAQE
jgi:hypothetical protein